jgi:hypothetical protein
MWRQPGVEQERPYPTAGSGKDRPYKARAESGRSREGVRGAHSVCLAASMAGGFKSLWTPGKGGHIRTRG